MQYLNKKKIFLANIVSFFSWLLIIRFYAQSHRLFVYTYTHIQLSPNKKNCREDGTWPPVTITGFGQKNKKKNFLF